MGGGSLGFLVGGAYDLLIGRGGMDYIEHGGAPRVVGLVGQPLAVGLAGLKIDLAILADLASAVTGAARRVAIAAALVPDPSATLAGRAVGDPP